MQARSKSKDSFISYFGYIWHEIIGTRFLAGHLTLIPSWGGQDAATCYIWARDLACWNLMSKQLEEEKIKKDRFIGSSVSAERAVHLGIWQTFERLRIIAST